MMEPKLPIISIHKLCMLWLATDCCGLLYCCYSLAVAFFILLLYIFFFYPNLRARIQREPTHMERQLTHVGMEPAYAGRKPTQVEEEFAYAGRGGVFMVQTFDN